MAAGSAAPDADRRRDPRRSITHGVRLQVIDPSRDITAPSRYQAVSRDISAHGMRILAERTFPANTPIRLAVEDDGHASDELTFHTGSIVWAHPLPGERRCLLGIQFGEGEALPTPA
ncbi:PilZ domain-containing protein [Thiocystis violacea]|uniref:PilZ domain-containing protein n=1 Tax=Thiocystis violacea TaxID=13725 RepID=UPI0023EE6DA5|nr:PilZ domain-containing protein [Thiocystis violacea]